MNTRYDSRWLARVSRIALGFVFVFTVSVCTSAQVLLVGSNTEKTVSIIDPKNNEVLAKLAIPQGPSEIVLSPDETIAYTANAGTGPGGEAGNTITAIDIKRREVKSTFDLGKCEKPHDIRVSRNGNSLWVVCAPSKTVLELSTNTGKINKVWDLNRDGAWMMTITPDNKKLYLADLEGGGVTIIDRDTNAIKTVETKTGEIGIDISPNGRELWFANFQTNAMSVLDVATDKIIATFESGGAQPIRLKFTPDGKRVVVTNLRSGNITIFDAATRKLVADIKLQSPPKGLTISADGSKAYAANPAGASVTIVDLITNKVVGTFLTDKSPYGMAWVQNAVVKPNSEAAFTISEPDIIPEGIAYDSVTQTFFVSSTYKKKIVAVDKNGHAKDFTLEGQDGLWGVVGMRVDAKRRILWANSSYAGPGMPMKGMSEVKENGGTGVFKYDLNTGKLVKKYLLDNTAEQHFLNDMTLTAQGDLFITDSKEGSVYRISPQNDALELFVKSSELPGANGIDISGDEKNLFVATGGGVARVDIESRKVTTITLFTPEKIYPDGLYFYHNSIVAIHPYNKGKGIARYSLNKALDSFDAMKVVEVDHPMFVQPTTGVVVGDWLYYIANSQLQYFRRLYTADPNVPADKLKGPVILKVRLID